MKRSCWTCDRQSVCVGYKEMVNLISTFGRINVTSDAAPGGTRQIYEAFGNACTSWKEEADAEK